MGAFSRRGAHYRSSMARRRCRAAAGCRRPVLLRSQPRTVPRSSGKILWVKEVTGPINGGPAVYEVNRREYVAVCVGTPTSGRGETATSQSAGEYVVFALPAAARASRPQ